MTPTRVRIFVGSPGDVVAERDSLNTVVNELTRTCNALLPSLGLVLELLRWETHAYPSMGRPQGVINAQIGEYDVFVGILWKRFGTPTGRAESGTEEEFRLAFDSWKKTKRPHILLYFNTAPLVPPKSAEEVRQLGLVTDFRERVEKEGLVWEYSGSTHFADTVRPHLTEVIGLLVNQPVAPAGEQRVEGKREIKPRRTAKRAVPTATTGPQELKPRDSAVVPGAMIRIADIGEGDAWYSNKNDLVGCTARVVELTGPEEGWYRGRVALEPKPLAAGTADRVFAKFRFEHVVQQDGPT